MFEQKRSGLIWLEKAETQTLKTSQPKKTLKA
jgi:hypothetical protein